MPKERDFCIYCGATIPPIAGEGTCSKCDPEHCGGNMTKENFNPQKADMDIFLAQKKKEHKASKVEVILRHIGMDKYQGVDIICRDCNDDIIAKESWDTPVLDPHKGVKWQTWSVM